MDPLDIAAVLLVLMAGFAFLNERYLRLPIMLGLVLMALLWSLALGIGTEAGGPAVQAQLWLRGHAVYEPLVSGLLGLLLFAGALRLNLADLARQTWVVLALVILGVGVSVFLVGTLGWIILAGLGITLPWLYGLLFGALIAPTDPVLVRGLLTRVRVAPELQHRMAGESVLAGGLAVVLFVLLMAMVAPGGMAITDRVLWQVGGSLLFGLLIGLAAYRLLRHVDHYQVEVLILLALVAGALVLAGHGALSGPLTLLAAGLVLGNHGTLLAMSEKSRRHLHDFWELIGGLVSAALFVLLALEVMLPGFRMEYLLAALAILPLVLLGRFIAMGLPVTVLRRFRAQAPGSVQIMTWGGVRGGISIALVLSLPPGEAREALVLVSAVVLLFAVVVQGLTFRSLVRHIGD
ncbi:cation:proton antiporter [Thiohalophilus sp.]|uniref:cation:proton antiporter domain-containing protein n=1 Tax=Thiohalophilus sp. TaxID=3028392 RepID=UPI002ACDF341|nr:cation:proton antiporter [Thiohalophilus sp.]MDZ7803851.1 cation:proton antiporter [Thiohalophilus sp.]